MKIKNLKLKILVYLLLSIFLSLSSTLYFLPSDSWADVLSDQTASVTVPAQISDYQIAFAKLTNGSQFAPGDEVQYQIAYGAYLSFNTSVTIEAQWYPGTVQSDNSNAEILDYVSNSATDGYGGIVPVVDTINKKITWTFNFFPGNTTNKIVTFKLKLNSNYTGSSPVDFSVKAKLYTPELTSGNQIQSAKYQYSSSRGPTPTATPVPSVTPTPPLPVIKVVEVREVTGNYANIFIQTLIPTSKTLRYGESPTDLNLSKSTSLGLASSIKLDKLSADTKYYFNFVSRDKNGKQVVSDLYTFKTAKDSGISSIDTNSLVAASQNVVITSPGLITDGGSKPLVIPQNSVFQIKFSLKDRTNVKKITAIIRNKNILGVNSFFPTVDASTETVDLIETETGVYSGSLQTKPEPGKYEIIAKIYDQNGSITEKKIAELIVINKLTVLSAKNNAPIEGARAILYIYSDSSKKYIVISSTSLLSSNPVFSDRNGKLSIVLPQGKYRVNISSLRFKDQSVGFSIGANQNESFPTVYLEEENRNIFKILRYYSQTLNDVFLYYTSAYAQVLTGSSRFFDLVSAITLGTFVILTLFAFSKKHHIPLSSMAAYFYYLIDHKDRSEKYIHGLVCDEKDKPIPSANVYIADSENEEIIEKAKTNSKGEFFSRKGGKKYLIMVMAKGYKTTPLLRYQEKISLKFKVTLEKKQEGINLIENIEKLVNSLIGMSFETIGILTLLLELLFISNFGLLKTAPFLTVSIFNIVLWTLYIHHHHASREQTH